MTFREKLAKEHPECINPNVRGGCERCPHSYGYESYGNVDCFNIGCANCWDREIPEEKREENAKIVCRDYGGIRCKIRVLPEVRRSQVINIETEADGKRILGDLSQIIHEYGCATMADLKDICGLPVDMEDREIGWIMDIATNALQKDGERYTITLPCALPLGDTEASDPEEPAEEARDETNPVHITIHTNLINDPDAVIADVFKYVYTIKDRVINISIQ